MPMTEREKEGYERSAKNFDARRSPSTRREHKAWVAAMDAMKAEGSQLYFEYICNRAARLLRECLARNEVLK